MTRRWRYAGAVPRWSACVGLGGVNHSKVRGQDARNTVLHVEHGPAYGRDPEYSHGLFFRFAQVTIEGATIAV